MALFEPSKSTPQTATSEHVASSPNVALHRRANRFWYGVMLMNGVATLLVTAWTDSFLALIGTVAFWGWVWALDSWNPYAKGDPLIQLLAGFGVVLCLAAPIALGAYPLASALFLGYAGAIAAGTLFRRWIAMPLSQ